MSRRPRPKEIAKVDPVHVGVADMLSKLLMLAVHCQEAVLRFRLGLIA
jgi:hypothetical protein